MQETVLIEKNECMWVRLRARATCHCARWKELATLGIPKEDQ